MVSAMTIKSFEQAAEYLRHGRNPVERPLAHATRIRWADPETIAIRYQDTDVVTYRADGSIILNTDGWYTRTSQSRIEEFSPFFIGRDSGSLWTVRHGEQEFPFADKMVLTPDGDGGWTATGVPTPDEVKLTHQWNATVRRDIRLAVRKWVSASGPLPLWRRPSGTESNDDDCPECHLLADGYVLPDNSHLWLHILNIRRGVTNEFPEGTQRAALMGSGWVNQYDGSTMAQFLRNRLLAGPTTAQGRTRRPSTEPII